MHILLFFSIIAGGIVLDHLSKYWAIVHLMGQKSRVLFPALLDLTYVENTGAAFGILSGHPLLLAEISIIILAGITVYTLKKERKHPVFMTAVALVVSGAIGNLIDRVFRGYVVDFLEFSFFDFPVFNIADCFVVVGVCLLALQVLFLEKEE